LLRRINVCPATNDFAVCNAILLAVLDQVRLCLRLGSLSKVVILISSIVISERALYSASPACPRSGYCRSNKHPGDAKAQAYLLHRYCPSKLPAMEQCHERHAWAISWKGLKALRSVINPRLGSVLLFSKATGNVVLCSNTGNMSGRFQRV
jgi:hypothetical protein